MALQGDLREMSVADLIQHYGQDQKSAHITIKHNGQQASLYFQGGRVAHAELDEEQGEEVVYRILLWEAGTFSLEAGVEPPAITIERSWSGLLLEGARRLDEESLIETKEVNQTVKKEHKPMAAKRKSDMLAEALQELLEQSADIDGAAVVGIDGLVYSANVPSRSMDEDLVGAAAATVLGLSKRSIQQLKRGNFTRTLMQGDDGNLIVSEASEDTLLVALTPKNVNLGMAFAEVRDILERLRDIL
ncbi:MAG: DUF4388 domain-containing protein [Anaerolineales bacterium]|nr:DUF4388 domain-containing protein [Anaerolineales bacterium]MCB8991427.1 DUF4388 domain-containing protein [Ardenticatenaceae bacterium]MCB9003953.1 DUF4388 domain-containing protein [Ardenticatenaceae bacterium]